jgi:hypothetical protein
MADEPLTRQSVVESEPGPLAVDSPFLEDMNDGAKRFPFGELHE